MRWALYTLAAPLHGQSALASSQRPTRQPATSRSPPACSGLPSGPEKRALPAWMPKRGCGGALWCLPTVETRRSSEIPLLSTVFRPRALLCDRAEAAPGGRGAQRAPAQFCRPRVVSWHLPRATGLVSLLLRVLYARSRPGAARPCTVQLLRAAAMNAAVMEDTWETWRPFTDCVFGVRGVSSSFLSPNTEWYKTSGALDVWGGHTHRSLPSVLQNNTLIFDSNSTTHATPPTPRL